MGLGRKQIFRSRPTVQVLKEKAGVGALATTAGSRAAGSGRAVLVPGVVVRVLPASRAEIPPCGGFLWP